MRAPDFVPGDELVFVALGGSGEIGMNLNLYGYKGRWLMIDCGITFGDDDHPGIDVIMPDPSFIAAQRDRIDAIVLTHGHEDHIGAVPYLWPRFKAPLYATPFAAALLRNKLAQAGLSSMAEITEMALGSRFRVGGWDLEYISLTHSIPEANAVALRTPLGTVLHTGDWKIDPDPLVGRVTDEAALRRLGDDGVLAMVCDSTNALRAGEAGSEADVRAALRPIVAAAKQRVVATLFASNVARLDTFATVAREYGREIGLVGRSLWRIADAARATGHLSPAHRFLSEKEIGFVPDEHALVVATGCQGEPRAALYRMATGTHPHAEIRETDTVIFSSRITPGNERSIARVQNHLRRKGARVVTERDAFVHVSGHPGQDELRRMYGWVRPRLAVPVHGEWRHMDAHARLAEDCGAHRAIVRENGGVIRLAPGPGEIVAEVPTGRLCADGSRILPRDSTIMRDRHRLLYHGAATVTLVLDARGRRAAPVQVSLQGVAEEGDEATLRHAVARGVDAVLDRESAGTAGRPEGGDDALRDRVRQAVRRAVFDETGRKPVTDVHLLRLGAPSREKSA